MLRRSDHLLAALVLGGENDVAHFTVNAAGGAVGIQLFERHRLTVHVFVPFDFGLALAMRHELGEGGWGIGGGRGGCATYHCWGEPEGQISWRVPGGFRAA